MDAPGFDYAICSKSNGPNRIPRKNYRAHGFGLWLREGYDTSRAATDALRRASNAGVTASVVDASLLNLLRGTAEAVPFPTTTLYRLFWNPAKG